MVLKLYMQQHNGMPPTAPHRDPMGSRGDAVGVDLDGIEGGEHQQHDLKSWSKTMGAARPVVDQGVKVEPLKHKYIIYYPPGRKPHVAVLTFI